MKKNYTHVAILLDRSGSMHQIKFVPRDMLMVAYRDDEEKCKAIQGAQSGLVGKLFLILISLT